MAPSAVNISCHLNVDRDLALPRKQFFGLLVFFSRGWECAAGKCFAANAVKLMRKFISGMACSGRLACVRCLSFRQLDYRRLSVVGRSFSKRARCLHEFLVRDLGR